ncbi:MAG TPA: glycosyltransferase [Chitinophagaceae bacterium]|nr:glycosyltransferase [Chitinophagaceae bacterium]
MPDQKHIVILGSAYPLRGGGLSTFNERLAREFMHEGHKVTIYTFSLQYPSFLFPGKSQYSTEPAPPDLDIKVKVNSVNPLNWLNVGKELNQLKPDLIVVRYWLPFLGPALGTICRQARKNGHTKIICIADNVVPHEKRPGDELFTRYFLKAADGFITMSEKVMKDLASFHTGKPAIMVNHPLYDNFGAPVSKAEARKHLDLPADDKIILFFGFIRQYKGLDMLFEAMDNQEIRKMNIKLLVAGEFYQDSRQYLDQIEKLGIKDSVILHSDFISDPEVKYYCCAADFIIQPYRNATQSGVTPLAYHFEKPMVVTNVGGLPAMVQDGETGLIAEPDPLSIAEHIIEAYQIGEDHFLPHIREAKKKYSWKKLVEAIEGLAHGIKS